MPTPKKKISQILLAGNARHLTPTQIAQRTAEEAQGGAPASVSSGRPKMPAGLTELEVSCWKAAVKILKSRGVLSKGDAECLELFCVQKARWITARREVEAKGLTVEETRFSKAGNEYTVTIENPALKICNDCEVKLLALEKVLGMTLLGREKVRRTKGSDLREKFVPKEGSIAAMLPELFNSKGQFKHVDA